MMKQPELGRKIADLRKAKGLTQEELVEKCNISVRTIQRIETGEVTPRSYTVKMILTALGYDWEKIVDDDSAKILNQSDETIKSDPTWLNDVMRIGRDDSKSTDHLIKHLHIAWIFGIIYFILTLFEAAAEYTRFKEDAILFGTPTYIGIKGLLIISFAFFQRGFIIMGGVFNNYLLKIISVIFIGANGLLMGYDIASLFYDSIEPEWILFPASLLYGVIGIIYGISLRRLGKSVGRIAKFAAAFELIAACFFLTVVLSFIGDIVHIPAELLEIITIFKAIEIMKTKETDTAFA